MKDYSLFTAEITKVNVNDIQNNHTVTYTNDSGKETKRQLLDFSTIAYTVNISPAGFRNNMSNVPILNSNSLTYNPPLPGDRAICAFVDGERILPVCLGVIYDPAGRTKLDKVLRDSDNVNLTNAQKVLPSDLLPSAAKDPDEVSGYKSYDYVVQHQTGSYIRMRNLSKASKNNSTGFVITPENNLPEIKIYQRLASSKSGTDSANSIILSEETAGQSSVQIYHHTGAYIKINTDGNIILYPASGKNVLLGDVSASEGVPLGQTLKSWLDSHQHPTGVGPSGPPIASSPSPSSIVKTK